MVYAGIDAGSVSVKLVVVDEDNRKARAEYLKHGGHPLKTALGLLESLDYAQVTLAITGSAGRLMASVLGIEPVNEVVAHAYSLRRFHPEARSILELGGEDSKLIVLHEAGVEDFSLNSVCAAGTGSFLDQQAERLNLTIEEFSTLALSSPSPPRIAGRCSVFAKSDMIHLQQIATPLEDMVAGLCFAVARNFKGSIMRGRSLREPVFFQGGVAANKGMVRAFREVLGLKELFVPEDFALMGAWGAALKVKDSGLINTNTPLNARQIEKLKDFLTKDTSFAPGHKPLFSGAEDFEQRHMRPEPPLARPEGRLRGWLGIDIGSISTNLALLDEEGNVMAKRYLMTAGRPIEAVREGMRGIAAEAGTPEVEILGVGTTGSGRYMIADFVGADIVKNEITAQATAAVSIDPAVDTIFEIGGQDSKYISLSRGVIVDFEMNKACAAGTGSFLEEQAEKLSIPVKDEFARCAFKSAGPLRLGERCTVFMENSLMANLGKGAGKNDLLAGLSYSVVQNYINRVVAGKPVGERIFFQGGVAFNKAVVAAFENYLGKKLTVPPHHDVTGAIGMALIARDFMGASGRKSAFKGFSRIERPYQVSSFKCNGCPNVCEINRVRIEGEKDYLFYGGRCEKYDTRRKSLELAHAFAKRDELLWKAHRERAPREGRPAVGLPYLFYFHDLLPFWSTLLWECGLNVEVSPGTNRAIVNMGLEGVLSEACFPVKVAHGHIKHLMEKGVDAVFLPSFINLNPPGHEFRSGHACPEIQTIPYVANVAFRKGLKLITLPVDLSRGQGHLEGLLKKALAPFAIKGKTLRNAMGEAARAQMEFEEAVKSEGAKLMASLSREDRAVVIVGRAYNSFDRGMNLDIPEKLSTLGVASIPMDFLPLGQIGISPMWPNMYWGSGQKILKAARLIRQSPNLYPIFIGNFLCGPDSFILKYFARELGEEKPFLHIEIDEHSADAGAITRCEAFLDSIEGRRSHISAKARPEERRPALPSRGKRRTVYIPPMSDHAFALKAAFEKMGTPAQVLPPSDSKTVELGERFVSGKECYPCLVTTGDMLKKVYSADFEPEESAFFMPSGTGPCRFGQYNVFHKQVLEGIGLDDVPVIAPNQDVGFYRDLGIFGKGFTLAAWKGIVAVDILLKCLHETRPYELVAGSADKLYESWLNSLYQAVKDSNGNLNGALGRLRSDFQGLPRKNSGAPPRPVIGIVGEIFVRSNRFSNEELVRKIEALGGEVWLAPVEEWVLYVNLMGIRKAWIKKDRRALADSLIKRLVQKRIGHRFGRPFKGWLRSLHEPATSEIMKNAAPYVHDSFEGETILSIGKAVDLIGRGASGIVNAMPFGCMPGSIVTALMRGVSRDYRIPAISIPYDGTESQTTVLQLEAFMEQARARAGHI